jgi:rod shape-determining protein MreD
MSDLVPAPVRVALVIFAALLVQLSVVSQLQFWGVSGDVLVVAAVAGGFVAGPERGAAIGFATGLAIDLLLTTPLGLTALVFTAVGYVSGVVSQSLIRSSRLTVLALTAIVAPVSVGVWVTVGALFGQTHLLQAPLVTIATVSTGVAIATIWLVLPLMRWAVVDPHARLGRR